MSAVDEAIAKLKEETRLIAQKKEEEKLAALKPKFDAWDLDEDGIISYDDIKQFFLDAGDEDYFTDEQQV